MSAQESGSVEEMLKSLRQDLKGEMDHIEQRLAQLSSTTLFDQAERKEVMTKAYLLGFARLSLGLNDIDEILAWLNTLNSQNVRQSITALH